MSLKMQGNNISGYEVAKFLSQTDILLNDEQTIFFQNLKSLDDRISKEDYANDTLQIIDELKGQTDYLLGKIRFARTFKSYEIKKSDFEDPEHPNKYQWKSDDGGYIFISDEDLELILNSLYDFGESIRKYLLTFKDQKRIKKTTKPTADESKRKQRLQLLFKFCNNSFFNSNNIQIGQFINYLLGEKYNSKKIADEISTGNYKEDIYDETIKNLEDIIQQIKQEKKISSKKGT